MATTKTTTCKIEHCAEPKRSLGYCKAHYLRQHKTGDPLSLREKIDLGMIPEPDLTCMARDCEKNAIAVGYCGAHYANFRNTGNPVARRNWTVNEVIDDKGWTVTASGCWEWNGPRSELGYGKVNVVRQGVTNGNVPRIMHERYNGAIPSGFVIRHKCDNPPCINPQHLETGTQADNTQDMVTRGRHGNTKKTHCIRGHDLNDPANVRISARGNGRTARVCRACKRIRQSR